jgi:hypothetical protein
MRMAALRTRDGGGDRIGSGAVGVVNGLRAGSVTEAEGEDMKATLEFDLPEEQQQFDDAAHGTTWRCVVQELDRRLRQVVKYGEDDADSVAAMDWREQLAEIVRDQKLSMYD